MPSLQATILRPLITATALLLAGCEIPGLGPDPRIAQREAEAKAIGGACRYGLRSIEDCYTLNENASKADMFTGWKDMDVYMRENKIEGAKASVVAPAHQPTEEFIDDPKAKANATKEKPGPDGHGASTAKSGDTKAKTGDAKAKPAASKTAAPAEAKPKPEAKPAEKPAAH